MEVIEAIIQYVVYTNPLNGFTIIKAIPDKGMMQIKARLKIIDPNEGMRLKMQGDWKEDKYGRIFEVEEWEEVLPSTAEGIKGYLSSGLIKGIGPVFAEKIVNEFKEDTLRVLSEEPEKLLKIKGMGKKKCQRIIEEWKSQEEIRKIMIFFKGYNLTTGLIIKMYNKYGNSCIELIQENPYRLIYDIENVGFITADSIAMKMGFDITSPLRIRSGVIFKMREICEDGDTYLTRDDITEKSTDLLDIDEDLVAKEIVEMTCEGMLIDDNGCIYLPWLYYAEKDTAERLRYKIEYQAPDANKQVDIKELENAMGIKYDDLQVEAIKTAHTSNIMVITGGPGTGKTTITRGIIELLTRDLKTVLLAAPTGKAAKRMSELTGKTAMTIHRLLEYNPATGFGYNELHPLYGDALIVDEASMINIELMHNLIKAVPRTMKLIIIGDVDQLPSIGSGNVLRDIIDSEKVPVIRLNKIFRQSQNSKIITNAHRVKNGDSLEIDNSKDSDFFFMEGSENLMPTVISLVKERIPNTYKIEPTDIQVLTPMKKNEVGTINLNNELQKAINPVGDEVKCGNVTFRVGDKVIQNVNDYEKMVFNGDSGYVHHINHEDKKLYVRFDDNVDIEYTFAELDELMLAYALTIHKSQGSEYPVVIIPITYANMIMMQRNLIYTAITRAKNICVVIGPKNMINRAIANVNSYKRKTKLKERICA